MTSSGPRPRWVKPALIGAGVLGLGVAGYAGADAMGWLDGGPEHAQWEKLDAGIKAGSKEMELHMRRSGHAAAMVMECADGKSSNAKHFTVPGYPEPNVTSWNTGMSEEHPWNPVDVSGYGTVIHPMETCSTADSDGTHVAWLTQVAN